MSGASSRGGYNVVLRNSTGIADGDVLALLGLLHGDEQARLWADHHGGFRGLSVLALGVAFPALLLLLLQDASAQLAGGLGLRSRRRGLQRGGRGAVAGAGAGAGAGARSGAGALVALLSVLQQRRPVRLAPKSSTSPQVQSAAYLLVVLAGRVSVEGLRGGGSTPGGSGGSGGGGGGRLAGGPG